MAGFETLTFLTPMALAALLILPVIYWLLKYTPPKPKSVVFPPLRLLLELVSNKDESDKTPLWLVLLRLALAAAIIIAVAQPILANRDQAALGKSPLLIVVDNDWASARDWKSLHPVLMDTIAAAQIASIPVALAPTNPASGNHPFSLQPADKIKPVASALVPQSHQADRLKLLSRLTKKFASAPALQIIWLSGGLGDKQSSAFASGLKKLAKGNASLKVMATAPKNLPAILSVPKTKDGKIVVDVTHLATLDAPKNLSVNLMAANGRNLASVPVRFTGQKTTATAAISLPLALRNEAARLEIAGQEHAGAVYLLDDNWRRKTVGMITAGSLDLEQPLLSPLYYVSRALAPSANLRRADSNNGITELVEQGLSMLVMADVGFIAPKQRASLEKWVANGGLLVRFAGPRLAKNTGNNTSTNPLLDDPLMPVLLRSGGRRLGSALSWEKPQHLAPFNDKSPLAGLKVDPTVTVTRQVLAEPTGQLSGRVWASLSDGTPMITASKYKQGLVVLVHVTANSDWSNLPLTGLFVEILQRLVNLAPAVTSTKSAPLTIASTNAATSFTPRSNLNGFARLVPPPPDARPIKATAIKTQKPSLAHPPGLYQNGASIRALNLAGNLPELKQLAATLSGTSLTSLVPAPSLPLSGYFFVAAFVLFLFDCLAALYLFGSLHKLKGSQTAASLILAGVLVTATLTASSPAQAQARADQLAMEAVAKTRFAYVLTGDANVDATSEAGLRGLNVALQQRTSIEPGPPQAIKIESDKIVFYPLLYWPVLANAKPPDDDTVKKLALFMKNGGTIFFDTRDQGATFANLTGATSPQTRALRRILEKFDIPALEPVPAKHVLTRAFYLMKQFPGRWLNGKLWVEASTTDKSATDGVSSIIIGANDYAAAWAINRQNQPLFTTVPGVPRQREFAYRTGINIVMYTLTGNYKADQVHVPALLERLGQ